MCCHENPACVNHRNCCMIGECNCACMPAQNPFGRFDLFLCAPPVFSWIDFSLWIPFKCFFPSYTFFGAHLYLFIFALWCVRVCVLLFFLLDQLRVLNLLSCERLVLSFRGSFVCVTRVPFFPSYAAFLTRGVQMQMQNEKEKKKKCVYSQCSCHLVYSEPLLEKIRPHWAWLGSVVISYSH